MGDWRFSYSHFGHKGSFRNVCELSSYPQNEHKILLPTESRTRLNELRPPNTRNTRIASFSHSRKHSLHQEQSLENIHFPLPVAILPTLVTRFLCAKHRDKSLLLQALWTTSSMPAGCWSMNCQPNTICANEFKWTGKESFSQIS